MPMDPPAPFHHSATRRVRQSVRVGVGVLVKTPEGKIFAGKRKGSHGAGSLALPGGHLEVNESWEECAKREIMEEMNVEISNVQFVYATNDIFDNEEKHYVTIFMSATATDTSTLKNCEPDKCDGWEAYTWNELQEMAMSSPEELFLPLRHLVLANPPSIATLLDS